MAVKVSSEEKERKKQLKRQKRYDETHKEIDKVIYKWCSGGKHWVIMNDENFYRSSSETIDGYLTWCKECIKQSAKKNQEENRERTRKYNRNYYHMHKDKRLPKIRNRHKIKFNEWQKYQREYQRNNKDKIKQYNENRQLHKKHIISKQEWISCKEYFKNCCAYCGMTEEEHRERFNQQLHKEHVDHEGANDLRNCVPSCKECNSKKWKYKLEDWYNEGNPVFNEKRLDKIHKWLNEDYTNCIRNK